jgi:16S rRNA (adenine1518-N6/adenine1519-N6)-dimethyltransferase
MQSRRDDRKCVVYLCDMRAAIKPGRKPKLGQNFLVSPGAPRAIVDALGDVSASTVVEIGPGRGALTGLLAARAHRLVAIELDTELAKEISASGTEVICEDILRVDLTRLAEERGAPLQVVGNLPYYISTPILMHLYAHSSAIDKAVLMAQREVAERVTASPGSREYGLLSATTQLYAETELLFTLGPEAFDPQPEVYSTVFRLMMRSRLKELEIDADGFQRFLRQAYAQKRKTLVNNLRAAGYSNTTLEPVFAHCQVHPQARAEAVALEAMACLYRKLRPA